MSGIGGQGVLFSSRVFSELGLRLGIDVLGSETHGMSQRGGSVIAHLKLGKYRSPLIREGSADFIYSFDKYETYRALKFLKTGGVCFVDCSSSDRIDSQVIDVMRANNMALVIHDACRTAADSGSARAANVVLIGYSLGTGLVPFTYDDVRIVLESVSRKAHVSINLKAFEAGYLQARKFKE